VLVVPPSANAVQTVFLQRDWAFARDVAGYTGQLIISLYQQKLTYGEFAQRRYEISRDAIAAERQFRETALIADQQRQLQAQQVAAQEQQARATAWAAYTQMVGARQPQTIHLSTSCMSQAIGSSFTMTNCH
jgi:hypothetical protein